MSVAEVAGAVVMGAMVLFVILAVRADRASARRYKRHEAARHDWLADPTNVELYQKWLRS